MHPRAWLHRIFCAPCLLCLGQSIAGVGLCPACLMDIPVPESSCRVCARPLLSTSGDSAVCGACLAKPPFFQRTIAAFLYQPPFKHLIVQLKYHERIGFARPLAYLLIRRLIECGVEAPDGIVPVPLSRQRMRERGYNQAYEIARIVSQYFQCPLVCDCVKKQEGYLPQTGLRAQERRRNVRGAYRLCKPCVGKRLVVVDDVMTTAATLNEMARLLIKGGAEVVEAWVLAQTLPK